VDSLLSFGRATEKRTIDIPCLPVYPPSFVAGRQAKSEIVH